VLTGDRHVISDDSLRNGYSVWHFCCCVLCYEIFVVLCWYC